MSVTAKAGAMVIRYQVSVCQFFRNSCLDLRPGSIRSNDTSTRAVRSPQMASDGGVMLSGDEVNKFHSHICEKERYPQTLAEEMYVGQHGDQSVIRRNPLRPQSQVVLGQHVAHSVREYGDSSVNARSSI